MGYAHGKNKVHLMGYMGGSQMIMPMGYAYGKKMISPMGYSYGSPAISYSNEFASASPEEQQEIAKMRAPKMVEAVVAPTTTDPIQDLASQAVGQGVTKGVTEGATKKIAEKGATEAISGAAGEAVGGAAGSLATNLLTKGEISEEDLGKAAVQAGVTAVAGPLAGFITNALFKDGTTKVPAMGYAEGTEGMSLEDFGKKIAKKNLKDYSQKLMKENPIAEKVLAPPLMIMQLSKDFDNSQIDLGKVLGANVKGGKGGLSFKNKLGELKIDPNDERISFRKTIRF